MRETPKTLKQLLDAWWETEPFGFDHPDTYTGILLLMDKARIIGRVEGFQLKTGPIPERVLASDPPPTQPTKSLRDYAIEITTQFISDSYDQKTINAIESKFKEIQAE